MAIYTGTKCGCLDAPVVQERLMACLIALNVVTLDALRLLHAFDYDGLACFSQTEEPWLWRFVASCTEVKTASFDKKLALSYQSKRSNLNSLVFPSWIRYADINMGPMAMQTTVFQVCGALWAGQWMSVSSEGNKCPSFVNDCWLSGQFYEMYDRLKWNCFVVTWKAGYVFGRWDAAKAWRIEAKMIVFSFHADNPPQKNLPRCWLLKPYSSIYRAVHVRILADLTQHYFIKEWRKT